MFCVSLVVSTISNVTFPSPKLSMMSSIYLRLGGTTFFPASTNTKETNSHLGESTGVVTRPTLLERLA